MFRLWFLFGFALHLLFAFNSAVDIVHSCIFKQTYDRTFIYLSYGFTTCIGTVWIITGYILRWQFVGQVCSGDFVEYSHGVGDQPYLWQSGQFMSRYIVAAIAIIGSMIVVSCLTCCFLASSFYWLREQFDMMDLLSPVQVRRNK